jgi:hypothetical protein
MTEVRPLSSKFTTKYQWILLSTPCTSRVGLGAHERAIISNDALTLALERRHDDGVRNDDNCATCR